MPLVEHDVKPDRAWGLWKIEEDEESLQTVVRAFEIIPAIITHPNKRLEYLAGRVLVKRLMEFLGLSFAGITKNQHGKPFLNNHEHHVSLSHSFPYVTVLIDKHKPVGVDLEQPKPKLLRIAPRILHPDELADAGDHLVKHCIYWCAKEAMLKVHGEKDLSFSENLQVRPFPLQPSGDLSGRITRNKNATTLVLHYRITDDFVLVYTC